MSNNIYDIANIMDKLKQPNSIKAKNRSQNRFLSKLNLD